MQKVSIEKFNTTLQRFVFENVIPKVSGTGSQFMLGAAYGIVERKIPEKMEALGVLKNGEVDVDCLEVAMKHGFKASSDKASFSMLGHKFTATPEDWHAFKRML